MSKPTICIFATNDNIDKIIISELKNIKTKNKLKLKLSDISYLNDQNELCDLYITLPKVETYGDGSTISI